MLAGIVPGTLAGASLMTGAHAGLAVAGAALALYAVLGPLRCACLADLPGHAAAWTLPSA